MSRDNFNTKEKKFKHITIRERIQIEVLLETKKNMGIGKWIVWSDPKGEIQQCC